MRVSVVVCTYNREAYILDSLTSLQDQTFSKDLYEVILVDNNSTDATPLLCMEFIQQKGALQIHYIKENKQGLSHARNTGIANSKGEIIVFLDDDAVACKTYIESIVKFFDIHPQAFALGGRIFPKFETTCPNWMPEQLTPLFSIIDLGKTEKRFPSNKYPVGANMAFRKAVFDSCVVFNTKLGRTGKNLMGGEEKDLFARIKQQNFEIWYSPNPWVFHIIPEARTTKEFIKKQAIGVGQSEYFRSNTSVLNYFKSLVVEMCKWMATFLLVLSNLLLLHPQRAIMLVKFRWWVSAGLLHLLKV